MTIIHHVETLSYYDCPLLFEAKDDADCKYIAVHEDELSTGCSYIVIPVTNQALIDFKNRDMDLRSLMLSQGKDICYKADILVDSPEIIIVPESESIFEKDILPELGQEYYSGYKS